MQQELCKNCHQVHQGNFCSHCGQKTNTVRLNWHYIKDEANYTILHFNKGFLYTIKELFTRPGDTIREFFEGKRVNHYKPLLLVFVLAGINGYLSLKLDMVSMMQEYSTQKMNSAVVEEYSNAMHWFYAHYSLFEILALPIVSLVSWISFRKWGYNYVENIVINCFAAGQRLIFSTFCLLVYLVVPPQIAMKLSMFLGIITFGLTVWTYAGLYKNHKTSSVVLRIMLFLFLLLFVGFILLIVFSIIFAIYLKKTGKI